MNKQLLLAFARERKEYMEALGGHIDPQELFRKPAMEDIALAVSAMQSFQEEKAYLPRGPELLEGKIENIKREFPLGSDSDHAEEAKKLIRGSYRLETEDLEDNMDVGEGLIKEFLWKFKYQNSIINKVKTSNSLEKGLTLLEEECNKINAIRNLGDDMVDKKYNNTEKYITLPQSDGLGVTWWNELFPHGVMKGNIYYILGPTGGGKSAAMTQLAWELALRGRVYFCMFEGQHSRVVNRGTEHEGLTSFQLQRFLCQPGIPGVNLKTMQPPEDSEEEFTTMKDLPNYDQIKEAMKEVEGRLGDSLLTYDGSNSDGPTSVGAILENIKKHHREEPLEAVFMDPLRQLIEETIVAEGMEYSENMFRRRAMKFADEITAFADEQSLPVFLTHQLRATDAERRGTKNIGAYAGGEVRTLSWPFQNVIVICPSKKPDSTHIVVPKSRMEGAANRFIKVKFEGPIQKFVPLSNESQKFLSDEDASDEEIMEESVSNILNKQATVEGVHEESFNEGLTNEED